MTKTGVNNKLLKQKNRGLLLKLIATGECSSRIELAQKTGLAKMTVSNIVSEFIESGILEEREKLQTDTKGRNPVQLSIAQGAPKLLGVHVYREEYSVILCDLMLHIIKKISVPITEENADTLVQELLGKIDEMLAAFPEEKILGIGIGAIGPDDLIRGRILKPTDFHGIHDLDLKKEIAEHTHLPVYFDSESNAAAMAEKYYGSGSDCEDFIYINLANGVGTGLVVNGKLYSNTSGMTCEFGHVSIDWKGRACSCGGRGWLETYISRKVLEEELADAAGEKKSFRVFCEEMDHALERQRTGAVFTERETKMDQVFRDMAEYLACGITNFVNGLNPRKVIVGYDGYWIPDIYLKLAERLANERLLTRRYRKIQVVKSCFGSEAAIYGSAASLLTAIFEGELFE